MSGRRCWNRRLYSGDQRSYAALAGETGWIIPMIEIEDHGPEEENIQRFESFCQKNGIVYRTYSDFNVFTLVNLKLEIRFSNIMVVGSETFYHYEGDHGENKKLRETKECVKPLSFSFPFLFFI